MQLEPDEIKGSKISNHMNPMINLVFKLTETN